MSVWTEQGKNRLEIFLHFKRFDEVAAMNALQDAGRLISDNCVHAADVAEADHQRAIDFLIWAAAKSPKKFDRGGHF